MSYWDTSALVKLYAKEADSTMFENHALNLAQRLATSRLTIYEARAVLRRKEAEGMLKTGTAQTIYSQLLADITDGEINVFEIGADVEREYGEVLEACYQHKPAPVPIRTLDALHLASARAAGDKDLVVTDKRMRDAARLLGFSIFPA
jgi:predicted nucleic acid-binding protein